MQWPVIARYPIKYGMQRPDGTVITRLREGGFSPTDGLELGITSVLPIRIADHPGV